MQNFIKEMFYILFLETLGNLGGPVLTVQAEPASRVLRALHDSGTQQQDPLALLLWLWGHNSASSPSPTYVLASPFHPQLYGWDKVWCAPAGVAWVWNINPQGEVLRVETDLLRVWVSGR